MNQKIIAVIGKENVQLRQGRRTIGLVFGRVNEITTLNKEMCLHIHNEKEEYVAGLFVDLIAQSESILAEH